MLIEKHPSRPLACRLPHVSRLTVVWWPVQKRGPSKEDSAPICVAKTEALLFAVEFFDPHLAFVFVSKVAQSFFKKVCRGLFSCALGVSCQYLVETTANMKPEVSVGFKSLGIEELIDSRIVWKIFVLLTIR